MKTVLPLSRRVLSGALALVLVLLVRPAMAHDFKAGSVVVDHPYAAPTPAGARSGAVYFRMLTNEGRQPDRLLSARSPLAAHIEIHESTMEGDVMRMRALPALDLAPGAAVPLRHGGRHHLMLMALKQPLRDGDRFPVTLVFERGGSTEVMVDVHPVRGVRPATGSDHH
ncbi:MAG: hypothetical protein RL654_781 [Pseudomonadota bacterium]|jgi:copper(I)-binding protein